MSKVRNAEWRLTLPTENWIVEWGQQSVLFRDTQSIRDQKLRKEVVGED